MEIESERRFSAFNWGSSREWQDYLLNIYPVPDLDHIHRIQRRWYRQHIDSGLSAEPVRASQATTVLAYMQVCFFVLLLPLCVERKFWHFAATAFFAGMIRKHGIVTTAAPYWKEALRDEDFLSICYCVLMLLYPYSVILRTPVWIAAVTISAELLCDFPLFQPWFERVKERKSTLLTWKAYSEVAMIGYLIANIFHGSILVSLLYLEFLHLKYQFSVYTKTTFAQLGVQIRRLM